MDVNIYDETQSITSYLKLSITSQEVAQFCADKTLTDDQIQAIAEHHNVFLFRFCLHALHIYKRDHQGKRQCHRYQP